MGVAECFSGLQGRSRSFYCVSGAFQGVAGVVHRVFGMLQRISAGSGAFMKFQAELEAFQGVLGVLSKVREPLGIPKCFNGFQEIS